MIQGASEWHHPHLLPQVSASRRRQKFRQGTNLESRMLKYAHQALTESMILLQQIKTKFIWNKNCSLPTGWNYNQLKTGWTCPTSESLAAAMTTSLEQELVRCPWSSDTSKMHRNCLCQKKPFLGKVNMNAAIKVKRASVVWTHVNMYQHRTIENIFIRYSKVKQKTLNTPTRDQSRVWSTFTQ